MLTSIRRKLLWIVMLGLGSGLAKADEADLEPPQGPVNIAPQPIASDATVKWDYPIVYVRAPRHGDEKGARWAEFSNPTRMEPGADLMLLRPDGSEEVLVSGEDGSVMDPYVSFDGEWVYYAKFIDARQSGSDIHKFHVPSRKVVKLTDQTFTPNLGAADWSKDFRTPEKGKTALGYGVFNLGPCPVPGGKVVYTTNRNAYVPPRGFPIVALQLFSMDDDGGNVEQIGYLNIAGALHPTILKDGRIIFSSLESQGLRINIVWGIWSIHPDGTNWEPIISAFDHQSPGGSGSGYHFQSQLSDGHLIVERYYNGNQQGFGTFFKLPPRAPEGVAPFGPGWPSDNPEMKFYGQAERLRFTPHGMKPFTIFAHYNDTPASPSVPGDYSSEGVGKVTHPSGAPDNHMLTVWSPGGIGGPNGRYPGQRRSIDGGLYLIKSGTPVREPGDMLLIKNDPKYNEQWPRALVPYQRIYGVAEPKQLVHKNDGKLSRELPEGTPFGLVGSSSLYKRESAPAGRVPEGSVTAIGEQSSNWITQGSDAGIYDNSEIHAIRILAQEPVTDILGYARVLYGSPARERLRILGEVPVRHFNGGQQPVDPDGNPDTSFLVKLPADQSFTFQTIDKHGMVLNMAQTWHQLRPGELRNNCGGCHSHSQKPTDFNLTAAAKAEYAVFDLTKSTPLLTAKANDQSSKQWDKENDTGLRFAKGIHNVEYYRDVRPILERSCVACHSHKLAQPAGALVLDDDHTGTMEYRMNGPSAQVPATYYRLVVNGAHGNGRFGIKYIKPFRSRQSPLVWKLFNHRTDGTSNDDVASLTNPKNLKSIGLKGNPVVGLNYEKEGDLSYWADYLCDMDLSGSIMPPPEAVAGSYKDGEGRAIKVEPLTDEDRRTLIRWIDLGCPIELDPNYDPSKPDAKSFGWMGDDQRPTLTLTYPSPGPNPPLTRLLVGMADAYTGLDLASFTVTADFDFEGVPAGTNLASRFVTKSDGVWELPLAKPLEVLPKGQLTVSVKDKQGNLSRIERTFSVAN